MTRIAPITNRAQLPVNRQGEWDMIFAGLGRVRGPFGVMLNSPGLGPALLGAVQMAHADNVVSEALHELIILAVAREYDAPYQWSAHIARAREVGVSNAAIEVARTAGQAGSLDVDERDIIELIRQLSRTHHLEQSLYENLVARHNERWVMLVIATIGQYQYVATFNNALEIDALPGDDQLPIA